MNFDTTHVPPFFFLHIKKSGGSGTMKLLEPHYVRLDKASECPCFIQSSPVLWNDILNNYRIALGKYQFKRALFAKEYLYKENWNSLLSFTFAREPVERTISMFYYLFAKNRGGTAHMVRDRIYQSLKYGRPLLSNTGMFDAFLAAIDQSRMKTNYISKHFTAHTISMHPDVTDKEGKLLISRIYRLESQRKAITEIMEELNLEHQIPKAGSYAFNKNSAKGIYEPNRAQLRKIEKLFFEDFSLYENAIDLSR